MTREEVNESAIDIETKAEEHRKRHIELHKALDELFADYIQHHPEKLSFLDMPVRDLIHWSFSQTERPTTTTEATPELGYTPLPPLG